MTTTDNSVLDLEGVSERVAGLVTDRLLSTEFDDFADALTRVGNCAHPIRLIGSSQTVDTATGEVVGAYSSAHEWGGVTRIACGNRRASVCPACSRVYAADTWQLISAGAAGGKKGVPAYVAAHPMVFATVTAPSFGPVHRTGTTCRPRRKRRVCEHGKPLFCTVRHDDQGHAVGQPLCVDCYDHESHVVWQWHAPELWRRFTITLTRALARAMGLSVAGLREVASVQFAKVAEYQRRGVVHFHALIRLDGPKTTDGPVTPSPRNIGAGMLAGLIRDSFTQVRVDAPPIDRDDTARRLRFGTQIDTQPIHTSASAGKDGEGGLSAAQVAGYIAKYATKSINDPDLADARSPHFALLRTTVLDLHARAMTADPDEDNVYFKLGRWASMLGFRGHFSTKSRRYSTTLGQLRDARRRWNTNKNKPKPVGATDLDEDLGHDTVDGEDTTLVIGSWVFAGQGWATDGDTALATAAAARAREHHRERAHRTTHAA